MLTFRNTYAKIFLHGFLTTTMKINPITFNPYSYQYKNTRQSAPVNPPVAGLRSSAALNSAPALLLNFNGGASLNLKSTIENLEFLGAAFNKMERIFPPKVKESATQLINAGNPENLKLVDVHKSIFGGLKDCSTLEDIKSLFREEKFFDNVISASDVEFMPKSYAQKLINGENQYFTKDEDLSVQLIKLYWGEGFSLTDLKTYTDGKDINHLLNRLNIPKRDQHYGSYLKLSDEEYNTRITREMAEKRMETLDRKAAEQEGEPVYIPRKPLSDLHRQHISEGLIRYYQEHPQACYNISQRQREFYEKNPDQKLIFSEVLKRAWGLKSAEGIKKSLSKFLSRMGVKNVDVTNPFSLNEQQALAMKRFWAENDWARKTHSKNMQYGWKVVKEEVENPPLVFNYPVGLVKDIMDFANGKGVKLELEDFVTNYNTITKKHMYNPKFFEVYTEFTNTSNNADIIASLYQYSLVKSIQQMAKNSTPQNVKARKKLLEYLTQKYQSAIYELDPKTGKVIKFRDLNIDQARTTFINVQLDLRKYAPELEQEFITNLTKDYPLVKAEGLKHRTT